MEGCDFVFLTIKPQRFRELWKSEFLPRLTVVKRKAKQRWLPEDLYHRVLDGSLVPAITLNKGEIVGICMIRDETDYLTLEEGLFVVATHVDNYDGLLDFLIEQWDIIAGEYDKSFVRFESPREGWSAKATNGWHDAGTRWEKVY